MQKLNKVFLEDGKFGSLQKQSGGNNHTTQRKLQTEKQVTTISRKYVFRNNIFYIKNSIFFVWFCLK